MQEEHKGCLNFLMLGLMVGIPIACVTGLVVSVKTPSPGQEYVPLAIRIAALVSFVYFHHQFWRMAFWAALLIEAVQERKLVWPGPQAGVGSRLYSRFVCRTVILIAPLGVLFGLVFPRFVVRGPVAHTQLWFMLVISAVAAAVMFSRAYDDRERVRGELANVGLR